MAAPDGAAFIVFPTSKKEGLSSLFPAGVPVPTTDSG
ncbi:MAG: hypothetical protein FD165_2712 [Gammaproteobacteria bacterium]|nr:MAG: hypothetical protein FD165_2712 [Gammaproteobacteria bacterium]